MPLGQRPSRRPGYKYDRTDLLLLGGGALLVVFGLVLALNAWLDPAARSGVTRRFSMLKPDSVARDSAAARLRAPTADDSAATASTGTRAPASDSVAAPVPGAPVVAAPDSAPHADSAKRGQLPAARVTPPTVAATTPPAASSPAPTATRAPATQPPAAAANTPATGFTLQVGAFGQRANADKLASAIGNLGFHAEVADPVAGAGTLHRVRVTGFSTRALAEAARDSIGRSLGERATVTSARQP